MSFRIIVTASFKKEFKHLQKKYPSIKNDLAVLIDELPANPNMGEPLGNSLYKIRLLIHSKGKGKSGGARVITYVLIQKETIYLAAIYDKSEFSTIDEKAILKSLYATGIIS